MSGTEGRGLVAVKDRAQGKRERVRTLLQKHQPEFVALLDWPDLNLPYLSARDVVCAEPAADGLS
jgi:hypothetical protein